MEKSDVLPWVTNSYITNVISHWAHVLLLNIGGIGHHIISLLEDVKNPENDVSFLQDGVHKCRVF